MAIEYTYPEPPRPTGADVRGKNAISYRLRHFGNWIERPETNIYDQDVPEVCKAMMTLAGHEWPKEAVYAAPIQDVMSAAAERIIGKLKAQRYIPDGVDAWDRAWRVAVDTAIAIVREECGITD